MLDTKPNDGQKLINEYLNEKAIKMARKKIDLKNGVLTIPINAKNKEFKELKLLIAQKADSYSEKQKREIELFALQIKMEDYLISSES